ncbi:MAG: N-acetylmuramoyl-L-alanine amidase [Fibrobacteraceae bacterium]|nr:N-acetylmuramoyl-L-alanine amidase [Fibrobacteraceae bacterium]
MIFAILLFLCFFSQAEALPVIVKNDGIWMVDIENLAKSEGLTTSWQPIERHFKAEGKNFNCSFVVGFPYIFASGKAIKLSTPTIFADDTIWVPATETMEIFSEAFSKNYSLDSAKRILLSQPISKDSEQKNQAPTCIKPAQTDLPIHKSGSEAAGSREVKNIVIDPGHGGKDPGAIGKISQEKNIALSIAKELKKALTAKGFNVKLTRETDTFIELSERPQIANRWNGDLFISLHCNAVDGPRKNKVEGFRVYVLRDPESEEDKAIARRENKVVTLYGDKDGKDEISPVEWFKIEARLEKYKQSSYMFTESLIKTYEDGKIKKMGSGAGGAGFMVLVGAFMPATLFELGFISNPEEEKYMNSIQGQKDIAKRIANAVSEYHDEIEEYRKTLSH